METIVGDVTGLQQRHYPKNIPHIVEKTEGVLLKAKLLRNTATYQKLWGGVLRGNGHNNFQHLWPNDFGSCCVCLHVA